MLGGILTTLVERVRDLAEAAQIADVPSGSRSLSVEVK